MYSDYIRWQFVVGPRWLVLCAGNSMAALLQLFSVRLMLRTLFAHWHKDAMPYRSGTISNYAMTFVWNMISRGIGLVIRTTVLLLWLGMEAALGLLAAAALVLFVVWPLLIIVATAAGVVILIAGL